MKTLKLSLGQLRSIPTDHGIDLCYDVDSTLLTIFVRE